MSQELLEKSLELCETVTECLNEADQNNAQLILEKQALAEENEKLRKQSSNLQSQLDNQVQLVKVASDQTHLPMEKVASVADTLVSQGFLPQDNTDEFKRALETRGASALLETLHKVASTAIVPVSYQEEGALIDATVKTASYEGKNAELLDANQQIVAREFGITVVSK